MTLQDKSIENRRHNSVITHYRNRKRKSGISKKRFLATNMKKRSTPLAFVVGPTVWNKNHADDGLNSLSSFTSSSVYHQSTSSSTTTKTTTTHLSLFSSSSSVTMAAVAGVSSSDPAAVVFEPIMPQTETLVGMGVIVLLSVIVSWVWANQVVPVSRTKLAIDKSRGELKEYLDELKEASSGGGESTTTTTTTISQGYNTNATTIMMSEYNNATTINKEETTSSIYSASSKVVAEVDNNNNNNNNNKNDNNRAFERWLFTDWLLDNKSARKAGRQKEPALPILKDAKWNSGDNPVIAASALIGLCVIVSSVVEKVATSF